MIHANFFVRKQKNKPYHFYTVIAFHKRFEAVNRIVQANLREWEWIYHTRSSLFRPMDEIHVVNQQKQIGLKIRVYSFGDGKPRIEFGSDSHRQRAEKIAKEIRREGWYLLAPLVESNTTIFTPIFARYLEPR